MRSKDLISTISYNSVAFLDAVLLELLRDHTIDYFMYIKHKGEFDSVSGQWEKDHIHLILQPSKILQTTDLETKFFEYVPDNDKPLRTRYFVSSGKSSDLKNFMNWLLYNLHDLKYLQTKGLNRQFHYQISDIYSNVDEDSLRDLYLRCKELFNEQYLIFDLWKRGVPWDTALISGKITPSNLAYAKEVYRLAGNQFQEYQNELEYGGVGDGFLCSDSSSI